MRSASTGDIEPNLSLPRHTSAIPRHLQRLIDAGASPADLALLVRHLDAVTPGELAWVLTERRELPAGLQVGDIHALDEALRRVRNSTARIPLGRACLLAESVESAVGGSAGVHGIVRAGSLRRFDATVGDIELVVVADEARPIIERFLRMTDSARVRHRSERKACIELEQTEVVLRIVPPASSGPALVHFTGSIQHNARLRRLASDKGLRLGPNGLLDDQRLLEPMDESRVYERLGLPFIAPELREDTGEIEAALNGELPALVERRDIRGDLHMHSTWSDGRDSIAAMVGACRELGYEYVAITDHSPASVAAGLDASRLLEQMKDIDRIRRETPDITILHGVEVDILPDGSLDLPDDLLARLDIVLASLHEPAGQSGDELTRRYLEAMRHPLVNIITHPTNRLVGQHPGYELDVNALIDGALQTGTALEIDGGPSHLDMDGAMARRAVEAGVLVSIDSDCHRADRLALQMTLGVATARRGWVEPRHVINTRPLDELRALVRRKRRRD